MVLFDGTGSTDPDSDTLDLDWTVGDQLLGSAQTLGVPLPFGIHEVLLTVDDGRGGVDTDSVTITVEDTTDPSIALTGDNPLLLTAGDTFTDPGAIATDTCGGDLTDEIVVESTVDAAASGSYTVTYWVSDPAGNEASVVRDVEVAAIPLTVTAADASMFSDGDLPTVFPLYSGFVGDDNAADLDVAPTCIADVDLGTTSCSGGEDAAYSFSYLPGILTVTPVPLAIVTSSLDSATIAAFYSETLVATGGDGGPYTWSLVDGQGTLPPGLTLDPSGVISGTTTESGTFAFTVSLEDSVTRELSITVAAPVDPVDPAATDDLAFTGSTPLPGVLGLVLLGGGLLFLLGALVARRRQYGKLAR